MLSLLVWLVWLVWLVLVLLLMLMLLLIPSSAPYPVPHEAVDLVVGSTTPTAEEAEYEAPRLGDNITPDERRGGRCDGGGANGDDGRDGAGDGAGPSSVQHADKRNRATAAPIRARFNRVPPCCGSSRNPSTVSCNN